MFRGEKSVTKSKLHAAFAAIAISLIFQAKPVYAQDNILNDISEYVFEHLPDSLGDRLPESLLKDIKTKSDFGAVLELGGFASDNLSVTDIDVNSGNDDIAAKGSILLSYNQGLGKNLKLGISYKGSQTLYEEFTDFDFQSHLLTAKVDYNFNGYKTGVVVRNVSSSLSGDDFLSLTQISPYISKFANRKTYLRGSYTYSDKTYEDIESRSALEHQGRLDSYYFLDGTRQYLTFGYALKYSDAQSDPFDFLSNRFKLGYVNKISFAERRIKLGASWSYENRNYDNITPSIGEIREDSRHRGKIEVEVPLNKTLYSRLDFQHQINMSNLPTADFTRNTVSLTFGAKF